MRTCVPVLALCLLGATAAWGQWVEAVIHLPDSLSGANGICWLEYDSLANAVYAAGWPATVAIDATTNRKVARLPYTGEWVGVDRSQGKLYICSDSVCVLDARTYALLATVPVNINSYEVTAPAVLCTTYHKLYVVVRDSVAVIDTRGDTLVHSIHTGHLFGLCLAEPEGKLYCHTNGELFVIDCLTDSIGTVAYTPGACWFPSAYNPLTRKLYYGSQDGMYVIDCRVDTVLDVLAEGHQFSCVFCDPQANRVYALYASYAVAVFDGATDSLVKVIQTGRGAARAFYSPSADRVYTLDLGDGGAIVDCVRDTLVGYFGRDVGGMLSPFCESPLACKVYCSDLESSVVTVLDGVGDSVEASVITGDRYGIGPLWYNAQSNKVLGLDRLIGGLSVIDASTNTHEGTRLVAGAVFGLVYNSAAQKLYTLDPEAQSAVVVSPESETTSATVRCPGAVGSVICANAASNKVFCGSDVLWAIDSRVDSVVAGIPLPFDARVLRSSPSAAKVYAAYWDCPQVVVVDAAGDSILRIADVPAAVAELGHSPTQRRWYCFGAIVDSLFVLDADGDSLVAGVAAPRGIAPEPVWNSCSDRLYYHSTVGGRRFVAVLDCRTNQVLRTLNATYVRGCDSVRNRVYCTDDSALLVFDGTTDSLIARVPVPRPGYITLNPGDGRVYLGSSHSDVYVVRDPQAVGESPKPQASSPRLGATVVRGVLWLAGAGQPQCAGRTGLRDSPCAVLLDAAGRKVMELLPGPNDVRHIAPGVYFVRPASGVMRGASCIERVSKVVVTR